MPSASFAPGRLGVILGSRLVSGWLVNSFCCQACDGGIAQLKSALRKEFGYVPWRMLGARFGAGILSSGGGSGLDRDGPRVQRTGARGSPLTSALGEPKPHRRLAALLDAFVMHAVVGQQSSFTLSAAESSGWTLYLPSPVVAAATAMTRVVGGLGQVPVMLSVCGVCHAVPQSLRSRVER